MYAVMVMFDLTVLCLTLLGVLTQVAIPLLRGTPLFPIFRREAKLSSELKEARQGNVEKSIQNQIKKEKRRYK